MHIVIPMSGIGKRFLDAGYKDPKPLIVVDGKPIIGHVVDMFPGETKFTFICNAEHLAQTNMRSILTDLVPQANIVSIPPHKKGPVYAVSCIYDMIQDDEEVIVNYCDFGKDWDYPLFLKTLRENKADGAISAYRGFHPHMLGTINYAFMREKDDWMLEIQEKKPFTDNRMEEYASDGTYYFRTGAILKKYFDQTMKEDISLNGEYYVSVVYNLLVRDHLKVRIFPIQHMLQWGTPGELDEYLMWSGIFRGLTSQPVIKSEPAERINLIPLAGKGSRFAEKGYKDPKPLIPVDGEAMVVHAAHSMPPAKRNIFVCLNDHLNRYPLKQTLESAFPGAKIVGIDGVTEGQAITVNLGLDGEKSEMPIMIAASDNGMLYDRNKFESLAADHATDAIVFTFRNSPTSKRNPQMYGWVVRDGNRAIDVSVKKAISDSPEKDDAIVGAFYFKSVSLYKELLKELVDQNIRVNNEFYADSLIGLAAKRGLNVQIMVVDHYICWGTPDDYNTYHYWKEFFSKCPWHPYGK
jgi:NDP-sugar pyrophosphorylase family protein